MSFPQRRLLDLWLTQRVEKCRKLGKASAPLVAIWQNQTRNGVDVSAMANITAKVIKLYKIRSRRSLKLRRMINMKLISLNVPEGHLKLLDKLVEEKKFPNRAEAIRNAVRLLLQEEHKI